MSTYSLTGMDKTAGLAATSCSRRVRVDLGVQSQIYARWIVALAPKLHVAHGGPVSRGRGATSATDLKVDVERRGELNICPFLFLRECGCARAHARVSRL